jgi:hypothetical protein
MNYRHGDVLLKKIDKLPEGLKKLKDRKVIKYGEATNHSHRFSDGDYQFYEADNKRLFLQVFTPSPLIHEEHEEIIIDPGMYEIEEEQEFDYVDDTLKKVVD